MNKNIVIAMTTFALLGCGSEEPQKVAVAPKQSEAQQTLPPPPAPEAEVKPSCNGGEAVFLCTLKKRPLTLCSQDVSDSREVVLTANVDGKEIMAVASDAERKSPIKIQTVYIHPTSYDTVYFEDNGNTYAITRCPQCMQSPWLTVYKGDSKVLVAQCDDESVSVDNIDTQYKKDKKGRVIKDGLYQEKKSSLNFYAP